MFYERFLRLCGCEFFSATGGEEGAPMGARDFFVGATGSLGIGEFGFRDFLGDGIFGAEGGGAFGLGV